MKKMSKKLLASIMAVSMLVALVPAVGMAQGIGTVGLETKLDNEIVVYKNEFPDANAFNAVYNKDVEGGIHFMGNSGAVKHTYKDDYKPSGSNNDSNYKSPQIRVYSEKKTHARGFWIDLDHILKQYGPGAYTFSFSTSLQTHAGLVEACLNTLENQTQLQSVLWGATTNGNHSENVNFGGHVLVNHPTNSNGSVVYNKTFTSTTYIPEDAEHLRFFFGGSRVSDTSANWGGSADYKVIYFDDLVITKKANSYKDPALKKAGAINLKSTITPLGGIESVTGRHIAAMYDADTNEMLDIEISDEMTITSPTNVTATLDYPAESVRDYKIKTFFFDGLNDLTPYSLSYNPHESLMPNVSFESPFTSNFRWTESGNNVDTNAASVYSGARGIGKGIAKGGTYIKIGEGATATAAGTAASATALANVLHENGMGRYKVSFMAKTRDNTATVKLQARRHAQGSTKMDNGFGSAEVNEQTSTSAVNVSTEWQKVEFVLDFYPKTYWGGTETISYRKNNYPFYLIATSTNDSDAIYIDDFKVEKVN